MKKLKLCVVDKKGITCRTYHIDFDETEGEFLVLRVADYNYILTKEGKSITGFIKFESNEDNNTK